MSKTSKGVLAGSVVFFAGCVLYTLYDKEIQRQNLRKGAILDRERQKLKKQNLLDLERNIEVESQYKQAMKEKEAKGADS